MEKRKKGKETVEEKPKARERDRISCDFGILPKKQESTWELNAARVPHFAYGTNTK